MKHRKTLKILALVFALVLIGGLLWFANGLVGNPISKVLARRSAESYMAETYAGTDYQIDEVGFSFKDGRYYAKISSPSSPDTSFSLSITGTGRIRWDSYEDNVTGRWNTYLRVDSEYREMVRKVLDAPAFPYESDICFGSLNMAPREAFEDPSVTDIPPYAMICEDLELDRSYDVSELGRICGEITFYAYSEEITFDRAAEILLELRRQLDEAGIGFRAADFVLRQPKPEEGPWSEEQINFHMLYEEIVPEDLTNRIEAADAALDASYAEQDAVKNQITGN